MNGDIGLDPREFENKIRDLERTLIGLNVDRKKLFARQVHIEVEERTNKKEAEKVRLHGQELIKEKEELGKKLYTLDDEIVAVKKKLQEMRAEKRKMRR